MFCVQIYKKTCKKQPINLYDNLGWLCEKHYDQNLKKQIAKHKIQKYKPIMPITNQHLFLQQICMMNSKHAIWLTALMKF